VRNSGIVAALRLEPVLVARSIYALPYRWSEMAVARDGPMVRYRSRRRWPGPTPAVSRITVEVGAPLQPQELGELDHYLTARWQLYTTLGPVLARSNVQHEPWPLHRAAVRELEENLVAVAGLPAPRGSRWCTGHPACGPGSARCARSGDPDGLRPRSSPSPLPDQSWLGWPCSGAGPRYVLPHRRTSPHLAIRVSPEALMAEAWQQSRK
jgi:hypothetical protein